MKIKVKERPIEKVLNKPIPVRKKPTPQSGTLRHLVAWLAKGELKAIDFSYIEEGMEKLSKDEPCLILMNHSCFTDLYIAFTLFKNRPFHISMTNDGFVGKEGLMRALGCIPTKKFIPDLALLKDMKTCFEKLHSSFLMYPEASYSFDGTETPLPESLGKCLKIFKVPVILIKTDEGEYLRDPLYNNLQKRNVKVSAKVTYLLSPEEIEKKSANELNEILKNAFHFDHFKAQVEKNVLITEPFRSDGLHRALYKCPHCKKEGCMEGKGIRISCKNCKKEYELTENGLLKALSGETEFSFVSDWYRWERDEVHKELLDGTYDMEEDVDILVLTDFEAVYRIGEGHLSHTKDGFTLDGCGGKLHYTQSAKSSYSLYADYYWYELGDMISIGDTKIQYYCFPKNQAGAIVAKARLAQEELYKIVNEAGKKTS